MPNQATLSGDSADDHSSPFAEEGESDDPNTRDPEEGQESLGRFIAAETHRTLDSFEE